MKQFFCPFLGNIVELTEERLLHIKQRHPDIEEFLYGIAEALSIPDIIRKKEEDILLFSYFLVETRKYIVVIVKTIRERNFILTCYLTSKLKGGEIIWKKD